MDTQTVAAVLSSGAASGAFAALGRLAVSLAGRSEPWWVGEDAGEFARPPDEIFTASDLLVS